MKKYAQIILTNESVINIELLEEYAPISVANFINLVNEHYYDGVIFHRIIKDFMIQTGGYIVKDNTLMETKELKPIKGEFKSNGVNNELLHTPGVLSMARTSVKDSATSQFFICANVCTWLDGEYAAFGKVTDELSLQNVLAISNMETGMLSREFADFPLEVIGIKTIVLGDTKF